MVYQYLTFLYPFYCRSTFAILAVSCTIITYYITDVSDTLLKEYTNVSTIKYGNENCAYACLIRYGNNVAKKISHFKSRIFVCCPNCNLRTQNVMMFEIYLKLVFIALVLKVSNKYLKRYYIM